MFLLLIPSFAFEGGWPPKVAGWMVTRKKVTFSRTQRNVRLPNKEVALLIKDYVEKYKNFEATVFESDLFSNFAIVWDLRIYLLIRNEDC